MHHSLRFGILLLATLATVQSSIAAPAPAPTPAATAPSTHWLGWDHIEKLFVFGASYTATGFNWLQEPAPSASNPLGNHNRGTTASNGPNFVEYLTTTFNASQILTYNFAYPGAQVDAQATSSKSRPGKDKPANDMVNQVVHGFIPSYTPKLHKPYADWNGDKSLFISFFAINDMLAYFHRVPTAATTGRIMSSYTAQLNNLYVAGARNFLLLNAPPMDQSPYFTSDKNGSGHGDHLTPAQRASDRDAMRKTIADYNGGFPSLVTAFQQAHPDATLFWYDTHALFTDMHAQPSLTMRYLHKVGLPPLQNMTESCDFYTKYETKAGGKKGKRLDYLGQDDYFDPRCGVSVGKYFWLNGLHTTWAVHKIIAERIAEGLRTSKGGRLV